MMDQAKAGIRIPTPIDHNELGRLLQGYEQEKIDYLVNGFKFGFKIGYRGIVACVNCKNHPSIDQYASAAKALIDEEIQLGRIMGPYDSLPFEHLHLSPIALRPKSSPGKFRLIHNLSAPYDFTSINANIPQSDRSVSYESIATIIQVILDMGISTHLAKTDIKSAFRLVPVHFTDYHLLGFKYMDQYYFDRCMSMGSGSSCKIFEEFATALNWILVNKFGLIHTYHYLDDFCVVEPSYFLCKQALDTLMVVFKRIGVPISHDKTEGPGGILTFLGISLNARDMIASVPQDKLLKYSAQIDELLNSEFTTQGEIKSLIGKLNWCTSILISGRSFIRRFIDLALGPHRPSMLVTLTREVKLDLEMWKNFLLNFNGRAFIQFFECASSESLNFHTDASFMAAGGIFGRKWYQIIYPESWKGLFITFLELYPIVVGAHMFAKKLANKHVVFHTDNFAVMNLINKGSSPHQKFMPLLRHLALLSLSYNFRFTSKFVPGKLNTAPDVISRLQVKEEFLVTFNLEKNATQIPVQWTPSLWQKRNLDF